MHVQKDVAFDPGIRAVEVKSIIVSASDDVVNELHDGVVGTIAPREIHHVIVTIGFAEKVAQENAAAAALNTMHAVARLESGRRRGKVAVADHERRAIDVNIGRTGRRESQMVEE